MDLSATKLKVYHIFTIVFVFTEAKYARVRKVEIIPIMLENQWRADGWLGFILGDLLYFKFPQDDEKAFSNKYHELFTEISRFYEKKGFAIPAVENVEISSVDAPSREAKGNFFYFLTFSTCFKSSSIQPINICHFH